MNRRWGIRLVLSMLVFWLAWKAWRLVEADPILMLIFFIVGGVITASVFIRVVLGPVADAIGNAVFLSGGPLHPEDTESTEEEKQENSEGEGKTEES